MIGNFVIATMLHNQSHSTMKINLISYLAIFAVVLLFSSCAEKLGTIEIEFEEPTAGEIVADASDVHIHVHFHAMNGAEIHEVEVELHPDGDVNDLIIEFDDHDHGEEYVFEQEVDLSSYPSGTEFHLEALACVDHDCEETVTGDIEFSIP